MSEKEILAEKIRALITRNYARDLFDLWFLLNKKAEIDLKLINKKLSYYIKSFSKGEFVKAINLKKDIWKPELNPFIIGELPKFAEAKKLVLEKFKKFK